MFCERLVFTALFMIGMSGCTIKATTDTTTDGTTEFVSSTSGKVWWTDGGLVKQGKQAGAFVSVNHDNLMQDIAKGNGEYLHAFGKVFNVPSPNQKTFAYQLQQHYAALSHIQVSQGDAQVWQFLHQVELAMAKSTPPLL